MNIIQQLLDLERIASSEPPTPADVAMGLDLTRDLNAARYFYPRVTSEVWAPAIVADLGAHPEQGEALWLRVRCLLRVTEGKPETALSSLHALSGPFDQRTLHDIISAALKMNPAAAWSFHSYVHQYVERRKNMLAAELGKYFALVVSVPAVPVADVLQLLRVTISFERTNEASNPVPKFTTWDYQQIVSVGVTAVAKRAALPTAELLGDVVENLINLKFEGRPHQPSEDHSEGWCSTISGFHGEHTDPEVALVHALTNACELIWQSDQADEHATLDAYLRQKAPDVFSRIRHHLYFLHVARSVALTHRDVLAFPRYQDDRYTFEFARLIRATAEALPSKFLSDAELERIVVHILSGPDHALYKEFQGTNYSDANFARAKRYFHYQQLWPFEPLLQGNPKDYFREIEKTEGLKKTVESYRPFASVGAKIVEQRSPVPADELGKMSDEALVAFLNDWQPKGRSSDDWWVDISEHGLAMAFRDTIKASPDRFHAWVAPWKAITQPAYLGAAIEAGLDEIKARNFGAMPSWLELCWLVIHRPAPDGLAPTKQEYESGAWDRMRRAVVDFLEACVQENSTVPIQWRQDIGSLLVEIVCGPDVYLDQTKDDTDRDPLGVAINRTRGRAIEALVDFSWWSKRLAPEDPSAPELHGALARRFADSPPLTLPESALLGAQFTRIFGLDPAWTTAHLDSIFPAGRLDRWRAAFLTYVKFGNPYRDVFDALHRQFTFGLKHWSELVPAGGRQEDAFNRFGEHLLTYFLWTVPRAEELLGEYYAVTVPDAWRSLLLFLGRILSETEVLEEKIRDQCVRFFEWRLSIGNAAELSGFSPWLDAKPLDAAWRLRCFLAVLKITRGKPQAFPTEIKVLRKLADANLDLTVECFAELSASLSEENYFYDKHEDAASILRPAIASARVETVAHARRAQENLLRAGHFEFLHLD